MLKYILLRKILYESVIFISILDLKTFSLHSLLKILGKNLLQGLFTLLLCFMKKKILFQAI